MLPLLLHGGHVARFINWSFRSLEVSESEFSNPGFFGGTPRPAGWGAPCPAKRKHPAIALPLEWEHDFPITRSSLGPSPSKESPQDKTRSDRWKARRRVQRCRLRLLARRVPILQAVQCVWRSAALACRRQLPSQNRWWTQSGGWPDRQSHRPPRPG